MLETEDLNRIVIEIVRKIPIKDSLLPDTAEVREARAQLIKECAEIEARGHAVELPF